MKRFLNTAVATALAAAAWASPPQYKFKDLWRNSFLFPFDGAIAPNGNVYVADQGNHRVQYFTSTGSFLGSWGGYGSGPGSFNLAIGVCVVPNANVYVTDLHNCRVQYFNAAGSYLGQWGKEGSGNGEFSSPIGIARGPNSYIYVTDTNNDRVQYFTSSGSFLGKWGSLGTGNGQFNKPFHIAVAPNANVYVADRDNFRVQYFNSTGSFRDKWAVGGYPEGLDVATDSTVFVGCYLTQCVEYYAAAGSFLGSFGGFGSGLGSFNLPGGIAVTSDAKRVYVVDSLNHRVQYFDQTNPAVVPESLGRVKALFR